ncbi:hypothetical protein [uncultured Desulfovibrio sp.]|uniref:hypothetical protein n=1 Tax=uncultured Desulfovibrio sp. TaxID=167968 RepID=UPI00262C20B8|nr:hypothetical protein [uncultured Desulfovibrio sp.]
MPVCHIQNVLNGGEITPLLRGRVDQPRYGTGAREMRNFVPMPQGGVTRRPGTRFLGMARDNAARLIPFVFSATQGRMLEFGDRSMRVWLPDGRLVADEDGAPRVFESPYAAADLRSLRFAQSADVLYFAHEGYAPRKLSRHADDDWRWTTPTFMPGIAAPGALTLQAIEKDYNGDDSTKQYTYAVTAVDKDTGQESNISPEAAITAKALNSVSLIIRITWRPVPGAAYYRVYKKKYGMLGFIGKANEDCTFDDENIGADTEDTPPEHKNPFEKEGDWPSRVFFHQQRLGWASTVNRPITIWLSRTGEFESMAASTPPKDDDAIEVTLAATQANRIAWLQPDRQSLIFGTEGSEWTLSASEGVALTPSNAGFEMQTSNGGDDAVAAISAGGGVIYVQRGGRAVRQFAYNYGADKYLGQDLTLLARHMLRDTSIAAWAYQQEPHAVIWCVLSDGNLTGLTYMPEQEVMGWHRHDTDGRFRDVAVIPGVPDDQAWFLVQRHCGLCVERLDAFFDSEELSEAWFLDSALNYQGAPVTRFSGLDHLAGRAVQVFADGGTVDGLTVDADGGLTLPRPAGSVHAGLPYVSRLIPNLPEIQTQQGSSMMRNRKITAVRLRVYRSMSFMAGLDADRLVPIVDRHIRAGAFQTRPFFSDGTDLALDACGGWADETPLIMEVRGATPLTILALLTALDVSPYSGKGGF